MVTPVVLVQGDELLYSGPGNDTLKGARAEITLDVVQESIGKEPLVLLIRS
jgi:hypothetical protein